MALQATLDFTRSLAFVASLGGIGLGLIVVDQPRQNDGVEGSIQPSVAGAIEAVPHLWGTLIHLATCLKLDAG
jgi:hypothetical protein